MYFKIEFRRTIEGTHWYCPTTGEILYFKNAYPVERSNIDYKGTVVISKFNPNGGLYSFDNDEIEYQLQGSTPWGFIGSNSFNIYHYKDCSFYFLKIKDGSLFICSDR